MFYKILIFCFIIIVVCSVFLYGQQKPMIDRVSNVKDIASLFKYSIDDIDSLVDSAIEDFKRLVSQIENAPEKPSYQETFQLLDRLILSDFYILKNIFLVIEMVHPEKAMRDKAHEVAQKMVSIYITNVSSNRKLYDALMRFLNQNTLKNLTHEQQYFVKDTILAFQKDGLHLDLEKRNQIEQLKQDIADAAMSFERAIIEDNTVLWIPISELSGVPDFFITSLEKSPDDESLCSVRLDYPTVEMILQNCTHVDTRKRVWLAFNNRAYPHNEQHLRTLVNKRQELSNLLGYSSFIDYDLVDQMAHDIKNVDSFLTDLFIKSYKKGGVEFEILYKLSIQNGIALSDKGKLFPWNVAFLKELYKKERGLIDDQEIAEYFPLEKTVDGLFTIYQNLFSIQFKKVTIEKLWDEHVEAIQVYSKHDKLLGTLLIDLFPRVGKYSHACHIDVVQACCTNTVRQQGLSVVLANFSPATSERPSLLKLSEVRTFFHEFGHALHSLLGATEIASLSGTNTKLDFVELPSQLLEDWLWEYQVLKKLSCHFKRGESLSDQVIKKIIELKNFDAAFFVQRQIYLARLALLIHVAQPNEDFGSIARDLHQQYMPYIASVNGAHMFCSFGHLGGYSSRYYSYLWSKVFAADIFAVFKDKGLSNPYVGSLYVDTILKPGGTKDPNILLENFLGRKPTVDAFFKMLDL
jgi:thimet oligopeptidase